MRKISEIRPTFEVLLIEGNPREAYAIQKLLHEDKSVGYNVTWAKNLVSSLQRLGTGGYAFILLDLDLPDGKGLEALNKICSTRPEIPVVILARRDDEQRAIGALKRGAEDYFITSYADSRLLARVVRYAIDRHSARVALKESEQRATAILNSVLIGILLVDKDTDRIVEINTVAENLIGAPRERIFGRNCAEFIVGGELPLDPSSTDSWRDGAGRESVIVTALGGKIPILRNRFPVTIHNRQHIVESFLDLRPRKVAENALKESEARYKLLFNSVNDAIYACPLGVDGTLGLIIEANEVLCQRLGYDRAEILQVQVPTIQVWRDKVAEKLLAGERVLFEGVEVTKNGADIPIEASAHAFDFNGQVCALFITREIGGRRQKEAIETQKLKLEERERVVQEFVAKFSHELRTPLNAILGFSEVLADQTLGPLNPPQQDCLQDVHASGAYLLALIDEILDIAKIESGTLEIQLEWFSLGDLLDGIKRSVTQANQKKQHEVTYDIADENLFLYSSMLKLQQVLLNLLSNAIKFTLPPGHITLTITEVGKNTFYFAVTDNGPGIEEDDKKKIFQKFTRLRPEVEGTGLGLALSKQIIAQLGGDLLFESTLGKGSTFYFTLRF